MMELGKPKIVRNISKVIERELWARAAGRCEFEGCNRLLYKSPITQERVNIAEKAHIYSFSENGPRGWNPFNLNKNLLNDITNLILVCQDCHKTIDSDKAGERYSASLLRKWKTQHEERVAVVTGISVNKKSHVILYSSRIGELFSPLNYYSVVEAIFPDWYPAEEKPIDLSMYCVHQDNEPNYWITEEKHLKTVFGRIIEPMIKENYSEHFSLFALAPQPLLIMLGTLLTDKISVNVYQLHREPKSWRWQEYPGDFKFYIKEPLENVYPPVLIISLSDKIEKDRVEAVAGKNISIWELTIDKPDNDFLKAESQLSMFRRDTRNLMAKIKEKHGLSTSLKIFPAMPVSCAVELGRVRMPKANMPWVIFDQNSKVSKFTETLTINGGNK